MNQRAKQRVALGVLAAAVALGGLAIGQEGADERQLLDPKLTVGPSTDLDESWGCIKCHEPHYKAWKETSHAKSLAMPKHDLAKALRKTLRKQVKRFKPKDSQLCQSCHFTMVVEDEEVKPKYGVSCESCHGEGRRHVEIHSDKKQDYAARMAAAGEKGMIRPTNLYRLAQNCYECHLLAKDVARSDAEPTVEQLVNTEVTLRKTKESAHHPYGSAGFDLLVYSQGEVRHNYSDGKPNPPSPYRRGLYVVGKLLDVEYSLRALAKATDGQGTFFTGLKARLSGEGSAIAALEAVRAKVPADHALAKALDGAVAAARKAPLEANKGPELTAAADAVRQQAQGVFQGQSAEALKALEEALAGIEELLPQEAKGTVYQAE